MRRETPTAAVIALLLSACSGGSAAPSGGDAAAPGPADAGDAPVVEAAADAPPATDGGDASSCTFTLSGDTITDSTTGLHWAAHITSPESWSDGYSTCGLWGGRMPREPEIANIVVPVRACVAAGALTWDGPPADAAAWTMTPDPLDQTSYETIYFDGTPPASAPTSALEWVRCVK